MLVNGLGYADYFDTLGTFFAQLLFHLLVGQILRKRKIHNFHAAVGTQRQCKRKHYINVRIEALRMPHGQL